MLVIGLTGGVATGKSTVSHRLEEMGAEIIDADRLAREVVAPGRPALERIRQRFGDGMIVADGHLDRRRLGALVFRDRKARRDLEAIVHPEVRRCMKEKIDRLRAGGEVCVVVCDIPLLYESAGSLPLVDEVVVAYAPVKVQKERLQGRDGLSAEEADLRIRAQISTETKARQADIVIDNSGDLGLTIAQVDRLWHKWMNACSG